MASRPGMEPSLPWAPPLFHPSLEMVSPDAEQEGSQEPIPHLPKHAGALCVCLLPFADEVPAQKTETGAPKQKDEPLQSETHENGSKDHQKKLPPVCHSYVC